MVDDKSKRTKTPQNALPLFTPEDANGGGGNDISNGSSNEGSGIGRNLFITVTVAVLGIFLTGLSIVSFLNNSAIDRVNESVVQANNRLDFVSKDLRDKIDSSDKNLRDKIDSSNKDINEKLSALRADLARLEGFIVGQRQTVPDKK